MIMNGWVMMYKATIFDTRICGGQPKQTDIVEYSMEVVMVKQLRYQFGTNILEPYWI